MHLVVIESAILIPVSSFILHNCVSCCSLLGVHLGSLACLPACSHTASVTPSGLCIRLWADDSATLVTPQAAQQAQQQLARALQQAPLSGRASAPDGASASSGGGAPASHPHGSAAATAAPPSAAVSGGDVAAGGWTRKPCVWVEGEEGEYEMSADGSVLLPFTASAGSRRAVVWDGQLAAAATIDLPAERCVRCCLIRLPSSTCWGCADSGGSRAC